MVSESKIVVMNQFQLRDEALKLWPSLEGNFWPFDPKYQIPTLDELKALVEKARDHQFLRDYVNRGPVEDCDNAALYSSAVVHYEWARMGKTDPCPYGRAMGMKFRGMGGGHSLNVCYVRGLGYHFVDFDIGGRIWQATSEHDYVFYMELS